jgi:hypothetical protein
MTCGYQWWSTARAIIQRVNEFDGIKRATEQEAENDE